MRLIVTGGAGFIGSAVCRLLVARGHDVTNIDALTYSACLDSLRPIERNPLYSFEHADICDLDRLQRIFRMRRPQGVFHLAAESHVDRSIDDPLAAIRTNVMGTAALLQVALDHWQGLKDSEKARFRFVHVSTDEVFGSLGADGRFDEQSPYRPTSPYSASKAGSDHLVRAWWHTFGFPAIVTNCSNNYGPCQFPEKLIPLMIAAGIERRPLPVYGTGDNIRDWLHVDDHARALLVVLEKGQPGETYAIGGDCQRRNIDVVRAVCRILDARLGGPSRESLIEFVQDRPGHDLRYAIDAGKILRTLGWRPEETFETGLASTVDWYIANREWLEAAKARGYGGERLGLRAAG